MVKIQDLLRIYRDFNLDNNFKLRELSRNQRDEIFQLKNEINILKQENENLHEKMKIDKEFHDKQLLEWRLHMTEMFAQYAAKEMSSQIAYDKCLQLQSKVHDLNHRNESIYWLLYKEIQQCVFSNITSMESDKDTSIIKPVLINNNEKQKELLRPSSQLTITANVNSSVVKFVDIGDKKGKNCVVIMRTQGLK